jgi:hypothetical protein
MAVLAAVLAVLAVPGDTAPLVVSLCRLLVSSTPLLEDTVVASVETMGSCSYRHLPVPLRCHYSHDTVVFRLRPAPALVIECDQCNIV